MLPGHRIGCREVEIVDNDHARGLDGGELVGDGDGRVVGVGAVALQEDERIIRNSGPPRRDRRQQTGHETRRLGVGRVARQPGQVGAAIGCPGGQRRRLAVARRRRHQRHPEVAVETRAEIRSGQKLPTRPRNRKFGGGNNGPRGRLPLPNARAQRTPAPRGAFLAIRGVAQRQIGNGNQVSF